MRLLLDTHTMYWYIEDDPQLSVRAMTLGSRAIYRFISCRERMALGIPLSRSHQALADLLAGFHKKFLTFRSSLVGARFDAAIAKFRESIGIDERLVRDHPTVTDYRSGLAFALTGLGRAAHRAGHSADAVEPLRRAASLREAIPILSIESRHDLACDHALLAESAADPRSGLSAAAIAEANRAMRVSRS